MSARTTSRTCAANSRPPVLTARSDGRGRPDPESVKESCADLLTGRARDIIAVTVNGAVLIVVIVIFVALILALAKSLYF